MRRFASLAILALIVTACGAGDTTDTTQPDTTPAPPPSTTTTSQETTSTTAPPTTTTTLEPATECASPEGFTVMYPEDWETNEGDVVAPCTMFDPESFTVPPGTDERVAAINVYVENASYDTITSSATEGQTLSEDTTSVDGLEALRVEREADGDGLYPQGTLITSYFVELSEAGSTLVADTIDLDTVDYETAVEVLDEMMATMVVDEDQIAGVEMVGELSAPPIESSGFPASGEPALLTDVRIGFHDGFERVVFEFDDGTDLSYSVEYVEESVSPSGEPAEVTGEFILDVTMTPASGVDLSGEEPVETYTGPDRIAAVDGTIVEVLQVEDFESVLTWAVGVESQSDVAVGILEDPLRLVVDIASG